MGWCTAQGAGQTQNLGYCHKPGLGIRAVNNQVQNLGWIVPGTCLARALPPSGPCAERTLPYLGFQDAFSSAADRSISFHRLPVSARLGALILPSESPSSVRGRERPSNPLPPPTASISLFFFFWINPFKVSLAGPSWEEGLREGNTNTVRSAAPNKARII